VVGSLDRAEMRSPNAVRLTAHSSSSARRCPDVTGCGRMWPGC